MVKRRVGIPDRDCINKTLSAPQDAICISSISWGHRVFEYFTCDITLLLLCISTSYLRALRSHSLLPHGQLCSSVSHSVIRAPSRILK